MLLKEYCACRNYFIVYRKLENEVGCKLNFIHLFLGVSRDIRSLIR